MPTPILTAYDIVQQAAPAAPAAGTVRLYAGTDGKLYAKDPAGNVYDLTATGGGAAVATPTFYGRASTYRIPGRAGTTGQNLMTLWNGSASKVVRVKAVALDVIQQAVKAVTVLPPTIRFYRITSAPTGGVTVTKNAGDTSLTSDLNVSVQQDASADAVSAGTALAATLSGGVLTEEFAPRISAIGTVTAQAMYEMFDRDIFFDTQEVVIRPSQGLLLRLDYTLATQNPTTDQWIATVIWTEE